MTFSVFSIPTFLSALVVGITGVIVFRNNPQSPVNRSLSYFCASIFGWLLAYSFAYCSQEPGLALQWVRIGFVSVAFIPFTNLYFNLTLTDIAHKRRGLLGVTFLGALLFAGMSQSRFIYADIAEYFWGHYPLAGSVYAVFIAYYVSVWLYSLIALYQYVQQKKEEKDYPSYQKAKYVLIAWSGGLLGIVDFLPKYGFAVYPFAYLIGVYWILLSAYAVLPVKSLVRMIFLSRTALIASGVAALVIICSAALRLIANIVGTSSAGNFADGLRLSGHPFRMNPFSIPPMLTSFLILASGFYILFKDRASKTHRAFLYFCLSCFIWVFSYGLAYSCTDQATALRILRFSFIGVGFIAATNLYFYAQALQLPIQKGVLPGLFALAAGFVAVSQTTPYIYESTNQYFWGFYSKAGTMHSVFLVIWVLTWVYGSVLIYRKIQEYKQAGDFTNYRKAKFLYIAYLGECLGFIDFLPKYGIPVYPFGYVVNLYWVIIVSFAMLGHRLLSDMSMLIRRVLIASGVLGLLIVLFSVIFSLLQMAGTFHIPMATLITAVILALAGRFLLVPIYSRTRDFIDGVFFQEFHQRNKRMAELNQKLLISNNASEFSGKLVEAIYEAFKSIRVSFFLLNGNQSAFSLLAELNWGGGSRTQAEIDIPLDSSLAQQLQIHENLNVNDPAQEGISRILTAFGARLAIPIKSAEAKLLGFLLMGDKESGLQYTAQDIQDLKAFAKLSAVVARTEQLLLQQIELEKWWKNALKTSSRPRKTW